MVVNALQADVQKSKLPTESFVKQIDDVLQELLKEAANIKDPVRLMEWPGKGMVFIVGLDKYDSVDEIPDEEIQNIIRAAVKNGKNSRLKKRFDAYLEPDKKIPEYSLLRDFSMISGVGRLSVNY